MLNSVSYMRPFTTFLLLPLLFALILSGCERHKEVGIDKDSPQFDMQDSNKLFFRNMRQSYYDLEEMKAAKMEVFRISERDTSGRAPVLQVKIVQHWSQDKAYAMIEPHALFEGMDTLKVSWADTASNTQGQYIFPVAAPQPVHYRFASEIYSSIQAGHQLKIELPKGPQPLFPTSDSREPFRKTMVDFYRLVSVL